MSALRRPEPPSRESRGRAKPVALDPLRHLIDRQGTIVLDGGLATALESRGADLLDDLWSARLLLDDPDLIRQVHGDFLEAGADCISTATYQATIPGFRARGLTDDQAVDTLRSAVALAIEARDRFWERSENRAGRLRPLVAASIGPYGAYLADGSEYVGDYDIDDDELYAFHERRWRILSASGADLLACETIPSGREVDVLLRLLEETPGTWAWMSCSCRDGLRLNDGTNLEDVACRFQGRVGVAAVGVNCTAPKWIDSLIAAARRGTDLPVLVYPNSGEGYEPADKSWTQAAEGLDWSHAARSWSERGAAGVGGCCRVGAPEIATIRRTLLG